MTKYTSKITGNVILIAESGEMIGEVSKGTDGLFFAVADLPLVQDVNPFVGYRNQGTAILKLWKAAQAAGYSL